MSLVKVKGKRAGVVAAVNAMKLNFVNKRLSDARSAGEELYGAEHCETPEDDAVVDRKAAL